MAQLNSPTGAWLPQGPRTAKVRTREGIEEMDDDVCGRDGRRYERKKRKKGPETNRECRKGEIVFRQRRLRQVEIQKGRRKREARQKTKRMLRIGRSFSLVRSPGHCRRTRREEDRTAENVSQLGKGPLEELKLGRDRRETQRREAGFEEANLWGRRCRLWNLECQVMEKSGHCLEGGTGDPGDACARSKEILDMFNAPDSVLYESIVYTSICLAGKHKLLLLR